VRGRRAIDTTLRDRAPVAGINRERIVMMMLPSFPAKTAREFISYAKANPGKRAVLETQKDWTKPVARDVRANIKAHAETRSARSGRR
jgi:tripartite-type tricarboxylate transporter receptor subunit TctC